MGEALQELWRATLLQSRRATDHEVLVQPDLVGRRGLQRERDTGIARDPSQLWLVFVEVAGNDLIAFESDPDQCDARTAIGGQRDEVSQRLGFDERAGARW